MAGRKPYKNLRAKLTKEQQRQSDDRYATLKAGMLVAELRKHQGLTQTQLADKKCSSDGGARTTWRR